MKQRWRQLLANLFANPYDAQDFFEDWLRDRPGVDLDAVSWHADLTAAMRELVNRLDKAGYLTNELLNALAEEKPGQRSLVDEFRRFLRADRGRQRQSQELDLSATPKIATSRLHHAARELFGRDDERAQLDAYWNDPRTRVVTIVAWGGVGKTTLVADMRARVIERGDAEAVFDWSFYSQGTRDRGAVSADGFLREALRFFGDPATADSSTSARDKGVRLAKLVAQRRALLILDGLEPLQYPDKVGGNLKEESIEVLLRGLADANRGLCLVTTRAQVRELESYEHRSAPCLKLDHLSEEAGAALLESILAPRGLQPVASTVEERQEISRAVQGHALTLKLLGEYLRRAKGDVRAWREIDFHRADEEQGGHAFRVMEAYVQWLSSADSRGEQQLAVLRLLGLFDRPADPGCINAVRKPPAIAGLTESLLDLDRDGWCLLLASLEDLGLVTTSEYTSPRIRGYSEATARANPGNGPIVGVLEETSAPDVDPSDPVLDAHPLVREFFARELFVRSETAWREGHRRLFEYLCASVPYWPEGIDGLQPLYQAVMHGCATGQMEEVWDIVLTDRIRRKNRYYSIYTLGALSSDLAAVTCFFHAPWNRPSTTLFADYHCSVLSDAGYLLRSLGRLASALEPMRAGLLEYINRSLWVHASAGAGNLSELELLLGQIATASLSAKRAVEYAVRSENRDQCELTLTTLADAQLHAGDLVNAREHLDLAEAMQAEDFPDHPYLYSLKGFRYCDLLLCQIEREAWRGLFETAVEPQDLNEHCLEVSSRAIHARAIAVRQQWLLDTALDDLTLGRAALYTAILRTHASIKPIINPECSLNIAREHLEAAVDGLQKASAFEFLPRALLTRAWLHHLENEPDKALALLDDAWLLAQRGPMPLHQADILLHRARLFRDRDSLASARVLIERHGYGRRLPELEDAEQAACSWPTTAKTETP